MHDLDLDFAMLDLPTTGRCRAAEAPETDPVETRLAREVKDAPFVACATGLVASVRCPVCHRSAPVDGVFLSHRSGSRQCSGTGLAPTRERITAAKARARLA